MAANQLRLGVIGLGRAWDGRQKPALARLADRLRVVAVYDQVARRAEIAARQLDCRAVDGLAALVAGPDVDALLWLAPQWFGPHPVELAARAGKPIYAAAPLPTDAAELDRLDALARATDLVLMPEFPPRAYPATARLLELIRGPAGALASLSVEAVLLAYDRTRPAGPGFVAATGSLLTDLGPALADWTRRVMGAEIRRVDVHAAGEPIVAVDELDMIAARLGLDDSREASFSFLDEAALTRHDLPVPPLPLLHARFAADEVWVVAPDRLRRGDERDGTADEVLPPGPPVAEVLFDQFYRLVRGLDRDAPTWADALAAARVVGALRQSLREERPVDLPIGPDPRAATSGPRS